MKEESYTKKRRLPLVEQDRFPRVSEAMFDSEKLRKAFEYYSDKTKGIYSSEALFSYLYMLEKDVPLSEQRYQP